MKVHVMLNSIEKNNGHRFSVEFVRKHTKQILIVRIHSLFFNESIEYFVDLSEAIDVYNAWIDACEEANKTQTIVT
jgi:transcription elongation factor Elf1